MSTSGYCASCNWAVACADAARTPNTAAMTDRTAVAKTLFMRWSSRHAHYLPAVDDLSIERGGRHFAGGRPHEKRRSTRHQRATGEGGQIIRGSASASQMDG